MTYEKQLLIWKVVGWSVPIVAAIITTISLYRIYIIEGQIKERDKIELVKEEPKNVQKIESGGSGIQNNASNHGNQAGRDLTINNNTYHIVGKSQRTVNKDLLEDIIKKIPSKKTPIEFACGDNESRAFVQSIIEGLKSQGYLSDESNYFISEYLMGGMQGKLSYYLQNDVFYIEVPPQ